MEDVTKSIKMYIDSGEYFKDARKWYFFKYTNPFSERTFIFILTFCICISFSVILISINSLFPTIIKVKYLINAENTINKTAQIIKADHVNNNAFESLVDIMVRNYVLQRENYTYDTLRKQFIFIKNNSTRIVFRKFYNFMNIDNSNSPVLKYQKNIKRNVKILSADYSPNNTAVVTFKTIGQNDAGEITEDMTWQATLAYEIDNINTYLPAGTRFNFLITDYESKLIKDESKK